MGKERGKEEVCVCLYRVENSRFGRLDSEIFDLWLNEKLCELLVSMKVLSIVSCIPFKFHDLNLASCMISFCVFMIANYKFPF